MRGSREHYALLTRALRAARAAAATTRPQLYTRACSSGVELAARHIAMEMVRQIPSFDRDRFMADAGFGPNQTAVEAGQQNGR